MGLRVGPTLEMHMTAPTARIKNDLSEIKREVGQTMNDVVKQQDAAGRSAARFAKSIAAERAVLGMSAMEMRMYKAAIAAANAEKANRREMANQIRADAAAIREAAAAASALALEEAKEARASATAARERQVAIASADAYASKLEGEASAIGRTTAELRQLEVASRAAAAEQAKSPDIAARIRAAGAAYEEVARAASAAAAAEAAASRDAGIAHQQYEARVRQGVQAMKEAEAAAAADAQMVERLREMLDPAAAAQARLNRELAEARRVMIAAGASATDLARVEDMLAKKHVLLAQAQRFTASETLNISRQAQDIFVTGAMGMNPLMILVQQGPQIYDVLEQARARGVSAGAAFAQMGQDIQGGAIAGFQKLAPLITPVNVSIAGTALAIILAIKAVDSYSKAIGRFEDAAAGLGRVSGQTAQQLEAIAEAAAVSGNRAIGATRDSVAAFANAGIEGEQTLTSLASMVEKYAKLTGQDVPAAQAALATAMRDPAAAADTFTQQLGLLTGAQYEHIQQLAAQGDQEAAVSELTKILSADLAANAHQVTGLAHFMDLLGNAVSGVVSIFGRLDQRIREAGASYDAWLKKQGGGLAVDLFGTGNQLAKSLNPNAGRNQDQIAALNASQSMNTSGMREYNDLLARQSILHRGLANTTGLTAAQIRTLQHDYAAVTDTIAANRTAAGGWISTQERAHLVAQAQARLAGARTQTEKAAAQQTITNLRLGTQVLTQQERQTQAADAYNRVASRVVKPKVDRHAEQLAREAEAAEAATRNLYALANAYDVSGAQALIAEARVKAESQAIKQRGDTEAAVNRQIQLAIAQRVADAAKSASATQSGAAIQAEVNALIADGLVPAERANQLVRDRIADLPLLAAIEVAQQRGLKDEAKKATDALKAQQDARAADDTSDIGTFYASAQQRFERQLELQREELRLVGATDVARAAALATIQAKQSLEAQGYALGTDYANKYIAKQVQVAVGAEQNRQAQDAWNASLSYQADLWTLIADNAAAAGRGMSDAFGSVGQAIGDVTSRLTGYAAEQERVADARAAELLKAGDDAQARSRIETLYAARSAGAQINLFGDIASAAKGFFGQHSKGYKVAEAAEKAFRVAQMAMAIKAAAVQLGLIGGVTTAKVAGDATMAASDTSRSLVEIANSAASGAALAAKAVVNAIASLPFPLNIAAGAATAAVVASLGFAVAGAFGGGGKNSLPKANDGTGSVLGDSGAQSESIARAIEQLADIDRVTMTHSASMLVSLRSIDQKIGGLASLLVRTGNIDASGGVNAGFKTDAAGDALSYIASGGALGVVLKQIPVLGDVLSGISGVVKSLFGTKTSVVASGLFGGPQTIADVLNAGFDASYFSDVKKTKKFFGISAGTKYSTQYTGADSEIEQQFGLILRGFYDTIGAAAGPLGLATGAVEDRLKGFVVDLGKIDLQGLTGEEISEKLTAVFGKAADDMARAAMPGLEQFQRVGEGYFETLTRVAVTMETVSTSLGRLGVNARGLDIAASMGLAGLFDSLSDLTSASDAYFEAFYSDAERAAVKAGEMAKAFGGLGLAMPDTLAGYRALVEAQDLTTAAGRGMYATLLQMAPAFADLKGALDGAASAAAILRERVDLEKQMLELTGDTAAIRAAELAKIDPSNRALQQQIWAIQDAQTAAKAAGDLRDAWKSVGDTIMDEVNRIRALSDSGGSLGFGALMGQFNAANALARSNDAGAMDAAKSLPQLSKSLLDAAALAATSRQELDRVQAQTAAMLEATYGAIGGGSAPTLSSVATVQAPAAATTAANDSLLTEIRGLREEVKQLRSDNNAGHAATAGNTGSIDRRLSDVTSSGDAISVTNAA